MVLDLVAHETVIVEPSNSNSMILLIELVGAIGLCSFVRVTSMKN